MTDHPETELERKLRAAIEDDERDAPEEGANAAHTLETSEPEAGDPPAEFEGDSEALNAADPIAALEAEAEDLRDQLLRARAEFDNYRKRTAREVERIRKTAAEAVVHDLLPVLDNLELALQHAEDDSGSLTDGVRMVHKQMLDILERNGLEPIEALGLPFDPKVHEALSQIKSDEVPRDSVAQEYQRGYKLGGQVLRPSKVVVSLGSGEPSE